MTNGAHVKKPTKSQEDAKLDEALEETFPASDPPALTNPSSFTGAEVAHEKDADAAARAASDELDEELKETFPASDTPTALRKRGKDG
ncbi:hypothetical protein ABLE91_26505 [Aquabacter sp. CN5-332]|uniref:hypothetical protein n=1 Tax=Aquabacter sp. CN5-332 TaxID=3156608 RepID=UPI0032B4AB11